MPTIALVDDDHNILTSVSIALEADFPKRQNQRHRDWPVTKGSGRKLVQ